MPGEREVHVWVVELGETPPGRPAELSAEELDRAARFRFERDRRRFLAAHTALRILLAGYLRREARDVFFEQAASGKPRVAGIEFNLSHSGELALVAVACGTEVGVDVERVQPQPDAVAIAERFFPHAEAARVRGNPHEFYRLWTRREAWLKAEGIGLAGISREQPSEWTVEEFEPAPRYAGAVAFRGERRVLIRPFQAFPPA